jgi:glucose/mannose-6-phosphate isomerase
LSTLIGDPLFESLLWGHEYSLEYLNKDLQHKIETGHFKRLVFYGMGCSSVVSDIVKGFFKNEKVPIHVDVINDYDLAWFIDENVLKSEHTLVIIVCYSGWSCEPIMFYNRMNELTENKNLLVLTGGGKIADIAKQDGTSLILYQLRHADREYPLYHVQQFFSIFIDLFYKLKLTKSEYKSELQEAVEFLKKAFDTKKIQEIQQVAQRLRDSSIVFLSTPKWYVPLLKQTTMFFNEIAMVPAHRNLLHEYSHTEVAAFSDPKIKLSIVVFSDSDDDEYTKDKVAVLTKVFDDKKVPKNKHIEFVNIHLDQKNFFQKFFYAHFYSVYVAYYLGIYNDAEGRDLISITAGNPWWSQKSIEKFPKCVDIPGNLEGLEKSIIINGLMENGHATKVHETNGHAVTVNGK